MAEREHAAPGKADHVFSFKEVLRIMAVVFLLGGLAGLTLNVNGVIERNAACETALARRVEREQDVERRHANARAVEAEALAHRAALNAVCVERVYDMASYREIACPNGHLAVESAGRMTLALCRCAGRPAGDAGAP